MRTGLAAGEIAELTAPLTTAPEGFHVHKKIQALLAQRAEMGTGKRPVDYGMAEALAFGSLVKAGHRPSASPGRTAGAAPSTSATRC